jgi:hypothetical protein
MSEKDKKDAAPLYRADTVPPPPGESDAYNAPTKVGPMSTAAVAAMMREAERKGGDVSAVAVQQPRERATPARASDSPAAEAEIGEVPKVYDELDEDDKAATLLSPRVKPPVTAPTSSPIVDGVRAKSGRDAPLAPPPAEVLAPRRQGIRAIDVILVLLIVALAGASIWWIKSYG